jgi:hypothetical protein
VRNVDRVNVVEHLHGLPHIDRITFRATGSEARPRTAWSSLGANRSSTAWLKGAQPGERTSGGRAARRAESRRWPAARLPR